MVGFARASIKPTTAVILREVSKANALEESPGIGWLLFEGSAFQMLREPRGRRSLD